MKSVYSERQIQQQIIHFLQAKGYFCMRLNSGKFAVGEGRDRRFIMGQAKGTPDICFGLPFEGLTLLSFIEVKSEKGKLTLPQQEFEKDMQERGILHIVARSIEDVQEGIKVFLRSIKE